MIANRFKSVGWVAGAAMAALGCYLVSLQVASERAKVEDLGHRLLVARQDIRSLNTEFDTRSRLVQLERWNSDVLALTAPKAGQYLTGEMQLASLAVPSASSAPAAGPQGDAPDSSGLQAPAAVARVAYRRVTDQPATRLVHSVSLDLDAPVRAVIRKASLTVPAGEMIAYVQPGGSPRP